MASPGKKCQMKRLGDTNLHSGQRARLVETEVIQNLDVTHLVYVPGRRNGFELSRVNTPGSVQSVSDPENWLQGQENQYHPKGILVSVSSHRIGDTLQKP